MTPEMIGVPAFLIFSGFSALFGMLLSGKLRLGREYDAMKDERDWWRSRAERGARLAETATNLADRVIPPTGS